MTRAKFSINLKLSPEHSATFTDLDNLLRELANQDGLYVVAQNCRELQRAGIYEQVLLDAFVSTPTHEWPLKLIAALFQMADRRKLRAAGKPLPSPGPLLLYRGVAGEARRRRVRGFSWTDSLDCAQRFATRIAYLLDPAVYRVRVDVASVLAYVGGEEGEYVVQLPRHARLVRVERRSATAGSR